MTGLIEGADGKLRCWWHGNDPAYLRYHDEEWGRPVFDDVRLFEKMSLEGFQAGLSWLTILRKREHFRAAFEGFDYKKVALYSHLDIERLLRDQAIIRHRGKIEATINNARKLPAIVGEFGSFASYIWSFKPAHHVVPETKADVPAMNDESEALSKDLKKRGFKFVGPTTMYALMQADGLVNDHLAGCCVRDFVEKERAEHKRCVLVFENK